AGGVDRCYPASSKDIYDSILDGHGAIVSEHPPGSDHRAERFLDRNRIIAALSRGVVLVQADGRRSGALTTTARANEYQRELFAVPGDVESLLSAGPHDLIRKSGARICTGAEDIFAVFEGTLDPMLPTLMAEPPGLDEAESALVRAINTKPGRAAELAAMTQLELVPAMRALGRLELGGYVRRENGIYYRPR
ncbi:MAG: DNA-processing protein DprA, partial [Actinomycetota bacterium]